MKRYSTLLFLILAIFILSNTNCFSDDQLSFEDVILEEFIITTDGEGRWHYSIKVTNTGKKFINNVFYIKLLKNGELFKEFTLSKLLQGSTGGSYQTSNSVTMEKFFKHRVKPAEFKCILLAGDISLDEAKKKPRFKTVKIESLEEKVLIDSFSVEEKTYTAVLKNNSKYTLDVGIVALELCNGNMNYSGSLFKIIGPGRSVKITSKRGSKKDGCTGLLLKLIDHNCKVGSDLLFSKKYHYNE